MGEERDRLIRRLGEMPLSGERLSDADLISRRMEYYRKEERLPPEVETLRESVLVVGYGTLLSRQSVGRTVGSEVVERAFVPVVVPGFKRLFNLQPRHYEPSFRLSQDPIEVLAANIKTSPGSTFNGLAFRVSQEELPALDERERYYKRTRVSIQSFPERQALGGAYVYAAEPGSQWIPQDAFSLLPRWEDILLARGGAYRVGEAFGEMFDGTTYLADGETLMVDRYTGHLPPTPGEPSVMDFLLGFLPGAMAKAAQFGLLGLATTLVLALLVRRFSTRKTLTVRSWGKPASESVVEGNALASALRLRLEEIWRAHANQGGLTSSAERASLGNPRRESENIGSKAVSLLAGNSPIGFLVGLSSRVWPALELEGELVVGEDRTLLCCARLKRGRTFFHAWQVPVPDGKDAVTALADELACRIVLDTARIGVLDTSQSAGTSNWRAFRTLTQAMEIWNSPTFSLDENEKLEEVAGKLTEAIEADPGYALAWLNRGVLRLLTFRDAETNRKAREDFRKAESLARDQADRAAQTRAVVSRRVEGLAALGIARTLSQDRHRFGRPHDETVAPARGAAERAVSLLGRSPEPLYALAFSWHCTEKLEDIRVGREIYEEIIAKEPRVHPAVHNNLGYILMVGGERLRDRGQEEEAEKWWKEAEKEMRLTLKISDPKRRTTPFSHANLGNLLRLRGRLAEAEEEYLKALEPNPESSTYTNGLNELACLYAEMGREGEAEKYHELALFSTSDPGHQEKLTAEMNRARLSG